MPDPTPAVLELAGPAPTLDFAFSVPPAELELAGPAPAVAAGAAGIFAPAPAVLAIAGPAPRALVYANASLTGARLRARPAFTGQLRAYRHA